MACLPQLTHCLGTGSCPNHNIQCLLVVCICVAVVFLCDMADVLAKCDELFCFRYYENFEIDDTTGKPLSRREVTDLHYERLQLLQRDTWLETKVVKPCEVECLVSPNRASRHLGRIQLILRVKYVYCVCRTILILRFTAYPRSPGSTWPRTLFVLHAYCRTDARKRGINLRAILSHGLLCWCHPLHLVASGTAWISGDLHFIAR